MSVRAGPDGPVVGTLDTAQPVPPGKSGEVLQFEFATDKLAQTQPFVTVDDDGLGAGAVFECDETNNAASWPEAVCPTVMP